MRLPAEQTKLEAAPPSRVTAPPEESSEIAPEASISRVVASKSTATGVPVAILIAEPSKLSAPALPTARVVADATAFV